MKKVFSKIGIIFFMALILGVFSCGSVFAVTKGQQLTSPELGWQRIQEDAIGIKYTVGTGGKNNVSDSDSSGGKFIQWNNGSCEFKVNSSRIRIIAPVYSGDSWNKTNSNIHINIDGVTESFSEVYPTPYNVSWRQYVVYENLNLDKSVHTIKIYSEGDVYYPKEWSQIDAIDIDSTGSLIDPNAVLATGITLDKTSLNMLTNQTAPATITATVKPDNATNKTVAWKSSDETIAKVDNTGKVTAQSKAGTATITATIDGTNLSATCTVTVTNPDILATGITLNKTTDSLNIGSTDKLIPTIAPSNVTTTGVIWTSSNGGVVSVDSNGNIKGITAGTATITATTNNGITATCTVTVNSVNPTLDITSEKSKVNGGDTFTTYVALHNVTNIYAEDIRVNYDSNLFEFVGADVAKEGYEIFKPETTTTSGAIRFIVANKGENNGITGESQVLKLTFKAKNVSGKGKIEPSYGLVANGLDGTETETTCVGTEVEVVASSGDVNRDGKFSLADLAIDARHYNMDKSKWDNRYNVDVVTNGQVDEVDLKAVVDAMLKGQVG